MVDPLILPPKAAEVPPLQIADKAEPALIITQGRNAIVIPPKTLGDVLTLQFNPPAPVVPAVGLKAHAAPTQGELPAPLCPTSYNSVSEAGEVSVQLLVRKLALVDDVTLVQFPNIKTAALLFAVVIDGMADKEVDVAVYHEVGAVISKGVVLSTPEKATIAPVAADELAVTAKV